MKKLFFAFALLAGLGCFSQPSFKEIQLALDQGKLETAKKMLQDRISGNPGDAVANAYLGDIAGFEKDWDAAISFYKNLARNYPDSVDYNFKYGAILGMKALSVSKLQSVIYVSDIKTYLEKTLELDPEHVEARRVLVELYVKLPGILGGSISKAKTYADELKDLNKVDFYLAQAFIVNEDEGPEEAASLFKMAIEVHLELPSHKKRNILNYELGKAASDGDIYPQYGLKLLNDYIENFNYTDIYPLELAYLSRAKIQAGLKDKMAAIQSIDKALTLRANFKEALVEKRRIQNL
jgi:tetratricopeptide (TPR) repeat protein